MCSIWEATESGRGTEINTPPTAFCYESYVLNTGEPEGNEKEGGE